MAFHTHHEMVPDLVLCLNENTHNALEPLISTETFSTNNYTEAFLLEQRIHKERKDERPYKALA